MTVLFAILSFNISFASTSDTLYERAVYRGWTATGNAWSENTGWLTFSPSAASSTVYVADDGLSGYLYGENIGWISLSCRNTSSCGTVDYGVLNDASGNLSGFAWGENIGWIDFGSSTAPYQVSINSGTFTGYAYAENIGWINFDTEADSATTTWRARSSRAQCDDGLDNDNDGKIDYPTDTNCSSLSDNSEKASARRIVVSNSSTISTSTVATTTDIISTTTELVSTTSIPSASEPVSLPVSPQIQQVSKYIFNRNLKQGSTGEDVRQLQIFLNSRGFIVSTSGTGSIGKESTYYGLRTLQAVKKYQEVYKSEILTPLGLRSGTGLFYASTRAHVNKNNF